MINLVWRCLLQSLPCTTFFLQHLATCGILVCSIIFCGLQALFPLPMCCCWSLMSLEMSAFFSPLRRMWPTMGCSHGRSPELSTREPTSTLLPFALLVKILCWTDSHEALHSQYPHNQQDAALQDLYLSLAHILAAPLALKDSMYGMRRQLQQKESSYLIIFFRPPLAPCARSVRPTLRPQALVPAPPLNATYWNVCQFSVSLLFFWYYLIIIWSLWIASFLGSFTQYPGIFLNSYVYDSFLVLNVSDCARQCFYDQACNSFIFKSVNSPRISSKFSHFFNAALRIQPAHSCTTRSPLGCPMQLFQRTEWALTWSSRLVGHA